jgi:hypothetical protein
MKEVLAYVHPVLQVFVLLLALAALRLGFVLKRHYTGQRLLQNWEEIFQRHTQVGLLFTGLLVVGYALGLISMPAFRERPPFRSAHFFFGTLAFVLFIAGAYAGWRLKHGVQRYADVRDMHGFLVYLGLFLALGVAVMGFILLP